MVKLTPLQQFENIWKVKTLGKRTHKKDKQKCYQFFLDGWGCAVLDKTENLK